ncbi:hypothetical protein [Enterobacter cloacae]|uniref:Phage protein n=1 Tax=Enterobacter cloacae TaxID=550 RepID=A0A6S5JSW9_ENTCL|nr:hypothetical protein [Enterobacter cloacae]BBS32482.1 hypothetical protein WP5S18C02_26880 [Enterobacter cloacae]
MKQKFIEWFTKNNNGCSPAMEDDRSFVYEMTQHMFEAYQAGVAEGEARCAVLAAENAGLKEACGGDGSYRDCPACAHSEYIEAPDTPATDAFLAEMRAQGVEMLTTKLQQLIDEGNFEGDEVGLIAGAVYTGADIAAQLRQEAAQ